MALFEFRCQCGWVAELLKPRDTAQVTCPHCYSAVPRNAINTVAVSGFRPVPSDQKSYRREFAEYREAAAEVDYHYGQIESKEGRPVQAPNLFKEGVRRAKVKGR